MCLTTVSKSNLHSACNHLEYTRYYNWGMIMCFILLKVKEMGAHLQDHTYCVMMSGPPDGVQANCPSAELENHNNRTLKSNSLRVNHPNSSDKTKKYTSPFFAAEHWKDARGNQILSCRRKGCNKSFKWLSALGRHMYKAHTLKCPEADCDRRFGTLSMVGINSDLQVHLRAAHGHAKLVCGVGGCTRSFVHVKDLQRHKRAKHRVEPLQFVEVVAKGEVKGEARMASGAVKKLEPVVKGEDTVMEDIALKEVGAVEEKWCLMSLEGKEGEVKGDSDAGGDGVMVVDEEDPLCSAYLRVPGSVEGKQWHNDSDLI